MLWELRARTPEPVPAAVDELCDCTPEPIGGDVSSRSRSLTISGWLHTAECPVTHKAKGWA